MKRKAIYRLMVTRREAFYIHDEFDHSMMIVETEGEPIEYQPGVAGEFVGRSSVTFHDRVRGNGDVKGYATTYFQEGSLCSVFEGRRDARTRLTKGTWKVYKSSGKLANMKGNGQFVVRQGENEKEYIMELEGDYEFA